jgi:hypothetical protein
MAEHPNWKSFQDETDVDGEESTKTSMLWQ